MDGPRLGERQLVPDWSYRLVALSYFISWLGAYTSTQIVIHAKYSRNRLVRWLWTFLASVAFGFTAIWSMHFVGMLACGLDVRITFDIPLTLLSALVAVVFTFAAFTAGQSSNKLVNSTVAELLSNWGHSLKSILHALRRPKALRDPEAGHPSAAATAEERRPILAGSSDAGEDEQGDETYRGENDPLWQRPSHQDDDDQLRLSTDSAPFTSESLVVHEGAERPLPLEGHTSRVHAQAYHIQNGNGVRHSSAETNHLTYVTSTYQEDGNLRSRNHTRHSPRPPPANAQPEVSSARTSEDSSPLTLTTESSDDSTFSARRRSTSSDQVRSNSGTTLSSTSWSEPLHAGLSREARIRIRATARDKPVPEFGWKYWMKTYYSSITPFVVIRAAIWGLAIVFMHYCGMWAMEIPEGRIVWDWSKVILSYLVAFGVTFVGCVAMVHMEVHFGRQVAFSTIAAFGCCSMHYTGMWAATFYTKAPPVANAGYPDFLPFTILGIAVFVCVLSNAVLAHSAIISRNRMAEIILTKRRIWRIMAEKEAAEQANELKQQFISVASHEIRTPLHAVNGYCELLAMTNLTEEQRLYVTSIQQACHAINIIAGNVLDFSKLDRNNVEMSARPVLVDLRKMVEDQARIIVTRGSIHPPQSSVDIIVSVADNVPQSVYLDETYTFRILMNLLSNAQKFCEEGYVCVTVSMEKDTQVAIKISDTGCGIPKSFRNALFQPFRQADSSLTRPKQGTGLGLSIVKHLVQRMSGSVEVESVEGEGSTFTVRLPITIPTNNSPKSTPQPVVTKRVKIVYAHERTAALYANLWSRHGMIAALASHEMPFAELIKDTDAIWTNIATVRQSPALKELVGAGTAAKLPPLFVVLGEEQELGGIQEGLTSGKGVVLVKRPVIINALLDIMMNPEPHMGAHVVQSRVRFALPHGQTPAQTPVEERKEMYAPDSTAASSDLQELRKDKVLLVEDNLVNQHLGQRVLERLGCEVTTACNGQEAIDKVLSEPYLCVFMDCQMPVLDGFAATTKIRELEKNGTIHGRLPIIALTANVSADSEEKCRAAGMDHFLSKPFKMADLQSLLSQIKSQPAG